MLSIRHRQLNLRTYRYFYIGEVDGIVGPLTTQAYKDFQKYVGITVDGIYGNDTNYKLMECVKDLQGRLNKKGYNLVIDGIVGDKTLSAIKDFQKNNGLVVDGIAGPVTFKALDESPDRSYKYRYPVNFIYISQYYHSAHMALDLGWSSTYYGPNQAIYACFDGEIIENTYGSRAGYYIGIRHDNGDISRYMHLKERPNINVGKRVAKGEQIGIMGDTGNAQGNHLHFELVKNGSRVNPIDYLYVYNGQIVDNSCKNSVRYI